MKNNIVVLLNKNDDIRLNNYRPISLHSGLTEYLTNNFKAFDIGIKFCNKENK